MPPKRKRAVPTEYPVSTNVRQLRSKNTAPSKPPLPTRQRKKAKADAPVVDHSHKQVVANEPLREGRKPSEEPLVDETNLRPEVRRSRRKQADDSGQVVLLLSNLQDEVGSESDDTSQSSGRKRRRKSLGPVDECAKSRTGKDSSPEGVSAPSLAVEIEQDGGPLPSRFFACLAAQKRSILRGFNCPNAFETAAVNPANQASGEQLTGLLQGTATRAEGNSCLILGPRGSGKSQLVESCLNRLDCKPVVLRLSGLTEPTDRHALREMGIQLLQQTGRALLLDSQEDAPLTDDYLDNAEDNIGATDVTSLSLPPSSQLHTLIPVLATLNRPVVIILDSFDLFALHPRQSLLYCLLDAVQNCRLGSDRSGMAVIGIATRVDTVQLLEKRVKSRFSGRTIRVCPPTSHADWKETIRGTLTIPISTIDDRLRKDWEGFWSPIVDSFLKDATVARHMNDTFSLTKDMRAAGRLLTPSVLCLSPEHPTLSVERFSKAVAEQRSRPKISSVSDLSYPTLCILIASAHEAAAGHTTFTFEMLYDLFRNQVRSSASAPVQVRGAGFGMVRCTRLMLFSAFEELLAQRMMVSVGPSSTAIAKEFVKYRCTVDRDSIRKAVERSGQINLKKWLTKAQ